MDNTGLELRSSPGRPSGFIVSRERFLELRVQEPEAGGQRPLPEAA
jgi:hypothetical protein